jgi:hypothetical protein
MAASMPAVELTTSAPNPTKSDHLAHLEMTRFAGQSLRRVGCCVVHGLEETGMGIDSSGTDKPFRDSPRKANVGCVWVDPEHMAEWPRSWS